IVSSLLGLHARKARDPATLRLFSDMEARVRAIALAHEKVYQARDLSRIDLGEHVHDIVQGLWRAFHAEGADLRVELELAETWVSGAPAIPVGLMVNELVTNALKYAFAGRSAGTLRVSLRSDGEHHELDVTDDGIGLPADASRRAGSLGLRLVDTLVRQLG